MTEDTETIINLISYEDLLRRAYHTIKLCIVSIIIVELICLILGLALKTNLSLFLFVGLGLSSIAIYIMCKEMIKVICIKSGVISICDDEIKKTWIRTRGSDDIFFASLENNGKISLSESEYKEMKPGDKMYVVKYGSKLLKDIYPQRYTQLDQNLRGYYEKQSFDQT